MTTKYKMTGCARFLIFLVFLIPISYFGSKYLRNTGTWDKIKDKLESEDLWSSDKPQDHNVDKNQENRELNKVKDLEQWRLAYEEQQVLLARQEAIIEDLQEENDMLRRKLSHRVNDLEVVNSTAKDIDDGLKDDDSSDRVDGDANIPSLEELLEEADSHVASTKLNVESNETTNESLATWTFDFNTMKGQIELYRQDGKVMAKTSYIGAGRIDISELNRRGERLYVRGSRTGEYYIIRDDGDLDAYDQNGYQVTCRRI